MAEKLDNWPEGLVTQCPNCGHYNYIAPFLVSSQEDCVNCNLPISIDLEISYPEGESL